MSVSTRIDPNNPAALISTQADGKNKCGGYTLFVFIIVITSNISNLTLSLSIRILQSVISGLEGNIDNKENYQISICEETKQNDKQFD